MSIFLFEMIQSMLMDGFRDSTIAKAISFTNPYLAPINLELVLMSTARMPLDNATLHGEKPGNAVDRQIKTYRVGDAKTLNIYTVGHNAASNYAGYSAYPSDYNFRPQNDGIVMTYNFLPGADPAINGYNDGSLLVHEVGHWLGLYHTFYRVRQSSGSA